MKILPYNTVLTQSLLKAGERYRCNNRFHSVCTSACRGNMFSVYQGSTSLKQTSSRNMQNGAQRQGKYAVHGLLKYGDIRIPKAAARRLNSASSCFCPPAAPLPACIHHLTSSTNHHWKYGQPASTEVMNNILQTPETSHGQAKQAVAWHASSASIDSPPGWIS